MNWISIAKKILSWCEIQEIHPSLIEFRVWKSVPVETAEGEITSCDVVEGLWLGQILIEEEVTLGCGGAVVDYVQENAQEEEV